MAVTRRYRRRTGLRSRAKRRTPTSVRRPAGPFGLYRGTRAMGLGRSTARMLGRPTRGLNPFPTSKLVYHKYCDSYALPAASGAGIPVTYLWRANSLFDPDFTGVGHQPMFRDEMAAKYLNYTVLYSTIKIEICGTNSQELSYQLYLNDNTGLPTTKLAAWESYSCKVDRLDRRSSPLVLKQRYNAARWNKTDRKSYLGDDSNKTGSGSNPTKTDCFILYIDALNDLTVISAINIKVSMTFTALWRDPMQFNQS